MNQVQPTRHDDGPQSRGGKRKGHTITLPIGEYEELAARAAKAGLAPTTFIRQTMKIALALLDTVEEVDGIKEAPVEALPGHDPV